MTRTPVESGVVKFLNPLFAFLFSISLGSLCADSKQEAPLSAEETASKITAPEGFVVDVIASEPDITQPIALSWDHQGRLWIAECRTYSDRSKNYDLTESDRVIVLEDKDADGTFETRTVFAENLQRLTSVAVGYGGVWVLTPPTMEFIPDTDGDLVPDGPSVTQLDGFDIKYTRHTIANGLKWGPDGWLYGRQGIVAVSEIGAPGTPKEDRMGIDTGIWRYNPETEEVEAWTRGGTNPWGHDWNAEGELFYINTVIGHFWHGIPGAYTKRMFGQHQRPYLYRLIDMHADHWHFDINGSWTDTRKNPDAEGEFGGGHAHTGLMIYQADKWPAEYRNDVYTLNFHGRRINREGLHQEGSGYVAKHKPDFVKFPDQWFRGIDLAQGPDGDAYILDWSDTGECHDHDGIHLGSGRIYRVRYGEPSSGPVKPPKTFEELDAWLQHPNVWYARQAQLMIREKRARAEFPHKWLLRLVERWKEIEDEKIAVRYRQVIGLEPISAIAEGGGLSLRQFRDKPKALPRYFFGRKWMETTALKGSARERMEIASLLPRLDKKLQIGIAANLVAHAADADDHNYPLMVWYAIEPIIGEANEVDVQEILEACQIPEIRRFIIRRLAEDYEKNTPLISKLILAQPNHASVHLGGLSDALEGLPKAEPLPEWDKISALAKGDPLVDQLGAVFGDGRSLDSLFAIANDKDANPTARRAAVQNLASTDYPDLKEHLLSWLSDDQLSGVSVSGLAQYADNNLGSKIVGRFAYLRPEERLAAIDVLVSRPAWANALLNRIEKKQLLPDVISTTQARQIAQHKDQALTERLTKVWGEVNTTGADPAAKEKEAQLRKLITSDTLPQSNLGAGRALYAQRCASCHQLYGEGGKIGPDLTGSGRHELDYLIENVLYPSAVVPAGYQMSILKLKDGRTLSGIITASSEKRVTLSTIGVAEPTYLVPDQIESTETMSQSLMPAGLVNDLDETQLLDFFGYLMGDHQAAMPD